VFEEGREGGPRGQGVGRVGVEEAEWAFVGREEDDEGSSGRGGGGGQIRRLILRRT
jgi:hypothetical protein